MARKFTPKVVTANDLIEGDVVYLTDDGTWTRKLSEAALFTIPEEADERLSFAAAQTGRVVGAYLADAEPGETGPVPAHFREAFRATGPSNYFHGKQEAAEQA
ncbi:hypothetical protein PSA7680_00935 [Pseudoruegeria aquimaris]|uniref:Uncharacterized protein n=1 Tax=Pseudoruegeria aquimaris TaxID=393663 RepID=A0A1Y5RS26_9RHOB|nr:DUF2849 domain-containing protein [Pseudoruegeria aquimaris]SLN22911.1 hypothetical protein PSA7680_00935 [Pseudoruegeria aquimaris]